MFKTLQWNHSWFHLSFENFDVISMIILNLLVSFLWSIRVQTMENCCWFVKCRIYKMLTRKAAVELHTHGDVPIPSPRTDSDVASANGRIEWICHHGVTISVSSEILSTITFFVLHEIDGVNAVFNVILCDPLTDILPPLGWYLDYLDWPFKVHL